MVSRFYYCGWVYSTPFQAVFTRAEWEWNRYFILWIVSFLLLSSFCGMLCSRHWGAPCLVSLWSILFERCITYCYRPYIIWLKLSCCHKDCGFIANGGLILVAQFLPSGIFLASNHPFPLCVYVPPILQMQYVLNSMLYCFSPLLLAFPFFSISFLIDGIITQSFTHTKKS